jgi:hypothetical protein
MNQINVPPKITENIDLVCAGVLSVDYAAWGMEVRAQGVQPIDPHKGFKYSLDGVQKIGDVQKIEGPGEKVTYHKYRFEWEQSIFIPSSVSNITLIKQAVTITRVRGLKGVEHDYGEEERYTGEKIEKAFEAVRNAIVNDSRKNG